MNADTLATDDFGPIAPDPETEHRAALVVAAHLGRDCRDVLEMLGLVTP